MININEEMYRCILLGKLERFKEILDEGGDPNYNIRGTPPLFMALNHKKMEFIEVLFNHPEIDLNITNLQGYTILNDSLENKNEYILNKLIDNPIFIESSSGRNEFPIHTLIMYKRLDLIERLLNNKINTLNSLNSNGDSPLILAAKTKNKDIILFLLTYKPDLEIINNEQLKLEDYVRKNEWEDLYHIFNKSISDNNIEKDINSHGLSDIKRRRK